MQGGGEVCARWVHIGVDLFRLEELVVCQKSRPQSAGRFQTAARCITIPHLATQAVFVLGLLLKNEKRIKN